VTNVGKSFFRLLLDNRVEPGMSRNQFEALVRESDTIH